LCSRWSYRVGVGSIRAATAIASSSATTASAAASAAAATTLIITGIVSVVLSGKGSCLNRIVAASFVVELVDKEIKGDVFTLAKITADVSRFVRVGVLNGEDKLVYNALLRKDQLKILKLVKGCLKLISEVLGCGTGAAAELKEIALRAAGLIKAFVLVSAYDLSVHGGG
jgi:hypothetical protein